MTQVDFSERVVSAIGYLGVLFLIPLFLMKDSPYAQFHAKQSLVIFILWAVNGVLFAIPLLGWFVSLVGTILLFALTLFAMVRAYLGDRWEIPLIAPFAKKINFTL